MPKTHSFREAVDISVAAMAIDPVCKMKADEKTAKFKSEYDGKTYYFCAPGDKKEFDKNPKKYA